MSDDAPDFRLLPTSEIDAEALLRDRVAPDPDALAELRASILRDGVRQPVEVWELVDDPHRDPAIRWGLISGWRRLAAVRALDAEAGGFLPQFHAIPALIRRPKSAEELMTAMVEENEIRADLSPWDRGRLIVRARDAGLFPTLDEAVDKLHPSINRQKRVRLRQLAHVADELYGHLVDPEALSQRDLLRLADACQRGLGDLIRETLRSAGRAQRAAQWDRLRPILEESDSLPRERPSTSGRPRRISHPRPDLVIRRERISNGYALHFTGRNATSLLLDAVFDEIDRLFS